MPSTPTQVPAAPGSTNRPAREGLAGALLAALAFAAQRHTGHLRKDSSPFINHPIAVAEVLARVGRVADLRMLQAALLHDVIEDTDTRSEEVTDRFGQEVSSIVQELTDDESLPKPERKRLQVEGAARLSPAAKQIRIADKICNLQDITPTQPGDWTVERKRAYLDWAEQVVSRCRGANPALEQVFCEILDQKRRSVCPLKPNCPQGETC